MTAATTQHMTPDELTETLAANPQAAALNERLTPFTVIKYLRSAGLPTVGHLRASNALRNLHDAGLLHQTHRNDVYALRPDLPTSGNGHVWLRVNNRDGAPIEVIGRQPRPTDRREANETFVRWTCHGCSHGDEHSWAKSAAKDAQQHADQCSGQHLGA